MYRQTSARHSSRRILRVCKRKRSVGTVSCMSDYGRTIGKQSGVLGSSRQRVGIWESPCTYVANIVPNVHCPLLESFEDRDVKPSFTACSCSESVCAFSPRNTSLLCQISASISGQVRYPRRENIRAATRTLEPGRTTATSPPSSAPGAFGNESSLFSISCTCQHLTLQILPIPAVWVSRCSKRR